jgi:proteic killer suppression protein
VAHPFLRFAQKGWGCLSLASFFIISRANGTFHPKVILFDIYRRTVYVLEVIRTFRCADTERLFRREAVRRFKAIARQGLRKLDMLDAAPDVRTLSLLPGNRLERLKGDREGRYSIRINDQWRLCFTWRDGNAYEAEIVDYH